MICRHSVRLLYYIWSALATEIRQGCRTLEEFVARLCQSDKKQYHVSTAMYAGGPLQDVTNMHVTGKHEVDGSTASGRHQYSSKSYSALGGEPCPAESHSSNFGSSVIGGSIVGSSNIGNSSRFDNVFSSSFGGSDLMEGPPPAPQAALRAAAPGISAGPVECARTEGTGDPQWRRNFPWSQVLRCTCQI